MHLLVLLSFLAASVTAFSLSASSSGNDYINYTTVSGYFLQDDAGTNATAFDFMSTNFGLINRTYSTDRNRDSRHSRTQWQRFATKVSQLNRDASFGVQYKVLFMGRHGDGFHNDAQAFYGTPAWNCYYSVLDGNETVTWSDAHLSPLGVAQAKAVNKFWASEIAHQRISTPQTFYTSPLTRCLQTVQYTFDGLDLPRRHPFLPEVKELLREGISGHTCDRRNSSTYIRQNFPTYEIEPGFTENDELWESLHGESSIDQQIRSKKVLDQIFSGDRSTYISITSHSGEIGAILQVLGHRPFSLSTGAVIPVLVKAQLVNGTAPKTACQPYTAICTCTSPPAVTATTSECSYPTSSPPGNSLCPGPTASA